MRANIGRFITHYEWNEKARKIVILYMFLPCEFAFFMQKVMVIFPVSFLTDTVLFWQMK